MLTFAQAKAQNAKFGPSVGDQINAVLEMFLCSGKWKNSIRELDVAIYPYSDNGLLRYQITLPRNFETAVGIQFNLAQGRSEPGLIQSQWFKYVAPQAAQWGWWNNAQNGNNLCYCNQGVPDLGDGWATFRDSDVDYQIEITPSVTENTDTMNVRGVAPDGSVIYSTTGGYQTEGIDFPINGTPPASGSDYLANAPIVVVKPVTAGQIYLYGTDASNPSIQTLLAIYAPGETVPSYRRYQVPNPPNNVTSCRIAAKLRYVPLVSDNDLVIPENSTALTIGLQAWNYWQANEDDRAEKFWARAYELLNGSLREHQGTTFRAFQIQGGSMRMPYVN